MMSKSYNKLSFNFTVTKYNLTEKHHYYKNQVVFPKKQHL